MKTGAIILFSISLFMVAIALFLLVVAIKRGYFNRVKKDAYLPFTEDEPAGKPTDQLFEND